MTQTLNRPTAPVAAMVVWTFNPSSFYVREFPLMPVEEARDTFGGTLADAQLFVESVSCNGCGTEASETRDSASLPIQCLSCSEAGCKCTMIEDPHSRDAWFCQKCAPVCGCRECTDY